MVQVLAFIIGQILGYGIVGVGIFIYYKIKDRNEN